MTSSCFPGSFPEGSRQSKLNTKGKNYVFRTSFQQRIWIFRPGHIREQKKSNKSFLLRIVNIFGWEKNAEIGIWVANGCKHRRQTFFWHIYRKLIFLPCLMWDVIGLLQKCRLLNFPSNKKSENSENMPFFMLFLMVLAKFKSGGQNTVF